jgi:hypothetical protein
MHACTAATPLFLGEIAVCVFDEVLMTNAEYSRMLDELDRLLNDPDAPMQPNRIWALLAEISHADTAPAAQAQPPRLPRPTAH